MSAAYDTFDYPSYWIGREYEHKSEVVALKAFLSKINKIGTLLDVGAGFGRLVPYYSYRAKKIILSDPSSRLLKLAHEEFKNRKNLRFIHSSLENLPTKLRGDSVDLAIMVRVAHHIKDVDLAFDILSRLLKNRGYLILEFANKSNLKATIRQFLRGNLTFSIDLEPSRFPFLNYHPDKIDEALNEYGFDIIEKRSVSNIRSSFLKGIFSPEILVYFDALTQKVLSHINFGPSIFILARKRGK